MFVGLTILFTALALVGCLYTLGALVAVRSFHRRSILPHHPSTPGMTLLKPLHGAEPDLYENLESFVSQAYDGPVQIVFGVGLPTDSAIPVVARLRSRYPNRDIELVISGSASDGNGKIANLISMSAVVKHGIIVLSDSDICVAPDYLHHIRNTLLTPGVGLVTCLYKGTTDARFWSTLSTMAIDFHFFPSVLLGLRMEKAHPCLGATMAMRAETLERIGGFAAFSRHLADDYAIGEAVRQTGQRVAIDRQIVLHRCSHESALDVFFQELRWARTIRSINPRGYAGSLVTHPVPFAFLAFACSGAVEGIPLGCIAISLACRVLLQREVEKVAGVSTRRWLLGPLRDTLSLLIFVASYLTDVVVWRGKRYRVMRDGTMEEVGGARA